MVNLKAGIKMEIKKKIVLHKGKMNGISTLYYEKPNKAYRKL
jgi:hypothetical protein